MPCHACRSAIQEYFSLRWQAVSGEKWQGMVKSCSVTKRIGQEDLEYNRRYHLQDLDHIFSDNFGI